MSVATSPDPGSQPTATSATRLSDIEASLEAHFQRLSARKREDGSPTFLFAIEHGLDSETALSLGQRLGSSLGDLRYMSHKHQLCWVVHAAEQGYNFGGLEYWDTFAASTPNWVPWGDRNALKGYFEAFSQRFGTARPSGDWAQRYKYICWPIAHALLPRDLQVQLAQAIYRARHHLYAALGESDEVLGRLVAHFAHYPTHRFSLFLRDGRLAGWIVRTLLRGEGESSGLESRALARIVGDLRSEARARAWLTESRGVYQQFSVRPHGGNLGMRSAPWLSNSESPAQTTSVEPKKAPELEPRLSLIRVASDEWKPVVSIPSFMHLATHDESLLDHLEMNRVAVPCHGPKRGPASALLSPAGLERSIAVWPSERTPLLSFDQALPVFDDLVKASVQLRPSSSWLFKLGSDGIARHVLGTSVLPGERYVLMARDAAKLPATWQPQRVACEGVSAAAITIPKSVSIAFAARLQQAGLSATYCVTLAPVGAVPVGWSPQSLGEWLTTQIPCFLLKRNHDFTHYSVRIEGEPKTIIQCTSTSDQLVSLRSLNAGRHSVIISTHPGPAVNGMSAKVLSTATLSISIRQPRSWAPGRQPLPAMLVTCEPAAPTFSEFISGRVVFRADGDSSRQVRVRLDLLDGAGATVSTIPICEQRLPIEASELREAIGKALNRSNDALDFLSFDAAHVVIDGGDLGARKIVLQQAVQPLRWRYSQRRSAVHLTLIDDLENSVVRVRTAPFARPAQWSTLPVHQAAGGIDVAASGGLYVAVNADQESCVAISPAVVGQGFDLFRVDIKSADLPHDLETTLETFRLWSSARACGLAARHRQRQVLQALQEHGIGQIAGHPWREMEQSLGENPSQSEWEHLEASVQWGSNYGILLSKAWATSDRSGDILEEQFVKVTTKLRLAADSEMARCAWRLAGGFQGISAADAADACGKYARRLGSAMRGARLLRLFVQRNRCVAAMEEACRR